MNRGVGRPVGKTETNQLGEDRTQKERGVTEIRERPGERDGNGQKLGRTDGTRMVQEMDGKRRCKEPRRVSKMEGARSRAAGRRVWASAAQTQARAPFGEVALGGNANSAGKSKCKEP